MYIYKYLLTIYTQNVMHISYYYMWKHIYLAVFVESNAFSPSPNYQVNDVFFFPWVWLAEIPGTQTVHRRKRSPSMVVIAKGNPTQTGRKFQV